MSTPEPEQEAAPHGFARDRRITRGSELQRILKEGKRMRTRFLDVRFAASPLEQTAPRIGIIVPKARHTAVERNKLKRRLRELARTTILPGARLTDVLLIARGDSYDASFDLLRQDIQKVEHAMEDLQDDT